MKPGIALLCLFIASPLAAQPTVTQPAFKSMGAFIGISVADLEGTVRWYSEKLGLAEVMRPPVQGGNHVVVLEGGGLIVEIIHNPSAVPLSVAAPSIQHSTLVHGMFKAGIIVEDYDRVLSTLRDRGVPIVIGPFQPRDGQPANFIIRDNAGNLLQFLGG